MEDKQGSLWTRLEPPSSEKTPGSCECLCARGPSSLSTTAPRSDYRHTAGQCLEKLRLHRKANEWLSTTWASETKP